MSKAMLSFTFCTLFLIFYLKSPMAVKSTGCNPIYCYSILDSLFPINETSCSKLTDLVECVSQCFPLSSNDVNKGIKYLRLEVCSDSYLRDSVAVDKCISDHKYSLYSCVYHYLELDAQDPDVDLNVLKCWKKYNSNFCNHHMASCTDHESDIFNTLLETFIHGMYEDSCDHLLYTELSNVKLAVTPEEYSELAQCFDGKSYLIDKCLPKKWATSNLSMETVSQEDLCRAIDSTLDCIGGIVESNCSNLKRKFYDIVRLLRTNVISNCSENNEILFTSSEHHKSRNKVNNEISEKTSILELDSEQVTVKNTKTFSKSNNFEIPNEYSTEKISGIQINSHGQTKLTISDENIGAKLAEEISSVPIVPTNTSVVSTNSTKPIIIEKHVFITVAYRAKNAANNIYISPGLFVILIVIYFCMLRV